MCQSMGANITSQHHQSIRPVKQLGLRLRLLQFSLLLPAFLGHLFLHNLSLLGQYASFLLHQLLTLQQLVETVPAKWLTSYLGPFRSALAMPWTVYRGEPINC